jgi:anti-sigma-K factor RskA
MSAQDHERWREDLAGYTLGALEPEDSERLERHLEECPECRERLLWLRPAADLLPESVTPMEPPPQLRERLMGEVRDDAARHGQARARGGGVRGWFGRPATVALGAVVVIVAGVAGYELGTGGEGTSTVTGTQSKSGALARVERSGDSGTLQVSGLSQLPRSQVYQAWVQRGGRMEPSSLFAVRRNGTASAAIPRDLEGAQAVVVTVEPRGGSRQPTSPPLVSVPLSG